MAVVYQQQGKLEKALEIFNSVLETTIRVCVAVSPKTAGTYFFFLQRHGMPSVTLRRVACCLKRQIDKTGVLWLAVTLGGVPE